MHRAANRERDGPSPAQPAEPVPTWAIVSAGLSSALLTGGWLVADALQPASYSPRRQTVSVLAGHAGTDRWVMTAALFLVGGCYLVTAAGLTGIRVAARVLLAVSGLASIGIAASPEPIHGSTPQHLAWTALGEISIAVWPAFVARRRPARPRLLSRPGAATATAVSLALLGWLIVETHRGSTLGLTERLSSSVQTAWPFVVAVALRASRSSSKWTDHHSSEFSAGGRPRRTLWPPTPIRSARSSRNGAFRARPTGARRRGGRGGPGLVGRYPWRHERWARSR